jgi:ATP-dependent DNA ligase
MSDKLRYNLTDHLTKREVDRLFDLFNKIKLDLSDDSFPTRTNRLEAVENMKKVLEIHNYEITEYNPETAEELSNNKHQGRVEL